MATRHRIRIHSDSLATSNVAPIVQLWLFRLMVPLGAHREFIHSHGFANDQVAQLLGLGEWVEPFSGTFPLKVVRTRLHQIYAASERALRESKVPSCLSGNVAQLSRLVGLSPTDCRILEFAVLIRAERLLEEIADSLGPTSSLKAIHALAVLLDLPESEIRSSLDPQGLLSRSGLLSVESSSSFIPLSNKLNLLSRNFADRILSSDADPVGLLRDTVAPSAPPHLDIADYAHIDASLSILRPYLRHAVTTGRKGVNVFLHGEPGTGKSQLAKVLARELESELFEVASEDADGDPVDGEQRLRAFRAAQCLLGQRRAIILFDEMEDVFNDGDSRFGHRSTAQNRKAWMNRALEENAVPTLWLSNSAHDLDPAFIRRFDMVFELPVPPKKQRESIIREACSGLLDASSVARIAESQTLAPAVVAKAASVVLTIRDELGEAGAADALERLIGNTLETQGHQPIRRDDPNRLPELYDPAFIHADADLAQLAAGLMQSRSGRLCLYGPPGTGKTAYGRWLAGQLEIPLLVKRASDLMSMWVGGSEKNIARAFQQAEQEGALLLIDEVDSFLLDRRGAQRSWEVSLVNEMLTQMESFPGVFIASTNLMAGLDQAALRRFDLKVKFDYLEPVQACALLCRYCTELHLPVPAPEQEARLRHLPKLAPGDFAAVVRQSRFRPIASSDALLAALEAECAVKEGGGSAIGFLH